MTELLARSWAYVDDVPDDPQIAAWPATLLPGALDEPVLLSRERALSNVCTHRGAVLLDAPCRGETVRCPYHGRRFALDGSVRAAPGFDAVPDEPLPTLGHARLGPMLFASADDAIAPLQQIVAPTLARFGLDLDALEPDPSLARAYEIDAPWTLWCENYLEGFHIPYVHPELARTLDLSRYTIEVGGDVALQLGEAREDEPAFEREGRRLGGIYLFVFPLTALNFYPWGLSLNAVQPLGERTRVVYRAYTWDASLRERGARSRGASGRRDHRALRARHAVSAVLPRRAERRARARRRVVPSARGRIRSGGVGPSPSCPDPSGRSAPDRRS